MRKVLGLMGVAAMLAGCAANGLNRDRPDEFAVARQAPLVIPPDYALVPPQPGAAAAQNVNSQQQTLDALFGGSATRSAAERSTLQAAGAANPSTGVRSSVGDPDTNVVDKGAATRDIVAAPEADGQEARAAAGGASATTTPQPAQQPQR